MPRIAIGRISHETNTFSPVPTTLASFQEGEGILEGEDLVRHHTGAKTGLGGFFDVARESGWQTVGALSAQATPSGTVATEAHTELRDRLVARLRAAGPLDGVLLHLHGAMCSEHASDAEGDICRHIRAAVGPAVPVIVELDLHGNITPGFCASVDGVVAYRTNPHVDPYERGIDAARLLGAVVGEALPRAAVYIAKPPMLPPTINMRTAEGPMRSLLERAREWETRPPIINVSVFGGFPYADFDEAGTSIVVTAADRGAGQACADAMAQAAWDLRETFLKPLPAVPAAVDQALRLTAGGSGRPVVLADVADNPGGGGTGDTPELLRELVRRRVRGAAACIWDPETVRQATALGVGAEGTFRIGGKVTAAFGAPVEVRGRVGHLFRVAGIEPEGEPLLLIKSRGHFRADFEPIAQAVIEVDAPGAANPNLDRFSFARVRRPIWPLDRATTWPRPS